MLSSGQLGLHSGTLTCQAWATQWNPDLSPLSLGGKKKKNQGLNLAHSSETMKSEVGDSGGFCEDLLAV